MGTLDVRTSHMTRCPVCVVGNGDLVTMREDVGHESEDGEDGRRQHDERLEMRLKTLCGRDVTLTLYVRLKSCWCLRRRSLVELKKQGQGCSC